VSRRLFSPSSQVYGKKEVIKMVKNIRVIPLCIDEKTLSLIEALKEKRKDHSRSNVIRTLILERLAELSILTEDEKKAFGLG
jgi:metal-responsive CopG/Arc/MetJ family transcriptional regulator